MVIVSPEQTPWNPNLVKDMDKLEEVLTNLPQECALGTGMQATETYLTYALLKYLPLRTNIYTQYLLFIK